jgi:hypothetical protein
MLPYQQGRDSIVVFGLVWFVVNKEQDKHKFLTHYRIILDIANQKALQECPHNIQQDGFSGEAMKCSNEQLSSVNFTT